MIRPKDLLADLQKQLRSMERDLLAQSESNSDIDALLHQRYSNAVTRSRTGLSFESWRGQQLTQVAAGWLLACVYTRFCEDNALLDWPMLAGPGDRLAESRERQTDYFRQHPAQSDLDYLRAAVYRLKEYEATRALVDRHNPMQLADPSPDTATKLLEFWRRIDPATGTLIHDFTDQHLDTRFLGDLYQDLSEQARKDYALLQTPEFVEEFILDRTLGPAIDEYGLAKVKLIDPACGSGHFLLGAFTRLLNRWREQEPGTNVRVLVERALSQVHGVDINPYAVAIAQFRLVVAALTGCGITRLVDAPAWKIRIATGDSLRFGVQYGQEVLEGVTEQALTGIAGEDEFVYEYEDAVELQAFLSQRYHAVVANPPYITVKDPVLNELYRELWDACSGKYALSVPFAQRIFDLAVDGGFTGQITANSFMKREFGKKLVERFLGRTVDLTHVIDTSVAQIPGHSTPTVILLGRNRMPRLQHVRAVLAVSAEQRSDVPPYPGPAWREIVDLLDAPGNDTTHISVIDVSRETLARHPWTLAGGGAPDLKSIIERVCKEWLRDYVVRAGFFGITGADDVFLAPHGTYRRHRISDAPRAVSGDSIRDWLITTREEIFFPYERKSIRQLGHAEEEYLWPVRTSLWARNTFGNRTYRAEGRKWFEWHQLPQDKNMSGLSILVSGMSTHPNAIVGEPEVCRQSVTLLLFNEVVSIDKLFEFAAAINSSTAAFWLKQIAHNKGNATISSGMPDQPWSWNWEFTATKLTSLPLLRGYPGQAARLLSRLAEELKGATPSATAADCVPTRAMLDAARNEWNRIRAEMISRQEELDWEVYGLYGLLGEDGDDLIGKGIAKPPLKLGERAFEIALARKMESGDVQTEWFARHRSTPITEVPACWPAEYRGMVERRLTKIAKDPYLHLIERPECKRRWTSRTWEEMESEALRDWLLDRLEDRALWFHPAPVLRSVAQLADTLRKDAAFASIAGLYARDADLAEVVATLVRDQHVPFLAACRYTDSGIRVRAQWGETWEKQRQEDAGEKVGDIPVPPKYKQGDFRDISYWRNRGKLDVPKERFISYPDASRDGTLVLGWAGWDHLEQAQALTAHITERQELDAWNAERLTPLLAGVAELLPWVAQWHPDVDPEFGVRPADAYGGFLDEQLLQLGLTREGLTDWRPQPSARGRRRTT